MDEILIAFLFGILGGATRAGFLFLELYRLKKIGSFRGSFITVVFLLLAGGLGGILFNMGWIFSMLGGFAAYDLLESIAKIFKKSKITFKE